jgi:hypothetical protein
MFGPLSNKQRKPVFIHAASFLVAGEYGVCTNIQ